MTEGARDRWDRFLSTPLDALAADVMGESWIGRRFSNYEITSHIGSGGMGEVYRARDTRLGRDVAIKVLPGSFVTDHERVARFEREAHVLAALNHPHIAAIYGIEDLNGRSILVLELVSGETLADRIARGSVPLPDVLPIAQQITEALEAAHEQGIIHRDLKPSNIALTKDSRVKVFDFGLAKRDADWAGEKNRDGATATLTIDGTRTGTILGTAAYMSPEQARGQAVDKRTDIWAFGCVLYEMLTGRQAFAADTVSDQIAAVLEHEPDWTALPETTPAYLLTLLRRCLDKDIAKRLPHIGGARLEIREGELGDAVASVSLSTRRPSWLSWAAAAIAVGVASVALWTPLITARPSSARLFTELGGGAHFPLNGAGQAGGVQTGNLFALSPDGTRFAFVGARGDEDPSLFVRQLAEREPRSLPGTRGARAPFFSPDGRWIGFFADGALKKIPASGGVAVTLADAPDQRGGAWSPDGTIAFTPGGAQGNNLMRVSSAGGPVEPLTILERGEVTHRWPQFLRNGKALLYTMNARTGTYNDADIVVQELPAGSKRVVHHGGFYGWYLESGHLLFFHDGAMFAEPFDINRLKAMGPPVAIVDDVFVNLASGFARVAASDTGSFAYAPGRMFEYPVSWGYRDGRTAVLRATPVDWGDPNFSPDGRRLALEIFSGSQSDIYVYDWEHDTLRQLTFDHTSFKPIWTPDGARIVFGSGRDNKSARNLYWARVDGVGEVQRLTRSLNDQLPSSWHPNGRLLSFQETGTSGDVMVLPLAGNEATGWKPGTPTPVVNTPAVELAPAFSPDGRWIAYESYETGRLEVYVQSFPGPGGKWMASSGGGGTPRWSKTRPELLYSAMDQIMAVAYSTSDGVFRAEKPHPWTSVRSLQHRGTVNAFDLHPDGERVAMATASTAPFDGRQDKVVFILNFFDVLRRLAPVK